MARRHPGAYLCVCPDAVSAVVYDHVHAAAVRRRLAAYFDDSASSPPGAARPLANRRPNDEPESGSPRNRQNPGIRKSLNFPRQGSDELRVTSAWVMGQDNSPRIFTPPCSNSSATRIPWCSEMRRLSLVRFADPVRPRRDCWNARALRSAGASVPARWPFASSPVTSLIPAHCSPTSPSAEKKPKCVRKCPARSSNGSRPTILQSRPANRCCSSIQARKWFGNPCAPCT